MIKSGRQIMQLHIGMVATHEDEEVILINWGPPYDNKLGSYAVHLKGSKGDFWANGTSYDFYTIEKQEEFVEA